MALYIAVCVFTYTSIMLVPTYQKAAAIRKRNQRLSAKGLPGDKTRWKAVSAMALAWLGSGSLLIALT